MSTETFNINDYNIHESWNDFFKEQQTELNKIFSSIDFTKKIYPPKNKIFRVFKMPVSYIKVVFLGQDPYHGYGQANGLAFSVVKSCKIPPSLSNIYKELQNEFPDRNYDFKHGDISRWFTSEGIFLVNTALTVEESKANSHKDYWLKFTNNMISYINKNNSDCVFLLLGNSAKNKTTFIENNERIITGVHPSPLSANKGFFGSNIFVNLENLVGEIDWSI